MDEHEDPTLPYAAVSAYVWCIDDRYLVVAATRSDAVRLAKCHGWAESDGANIRRATQADVDRCQNSLDASLDG